MLLGLTAATAAAAPAGQSSSSIKVIAVDADPRGNTPRSVGPIDDCVSTTLDRPVDIDIVLPSPGIPADRGLAAFQFSLFYDPSKVWVTADDGRMLLTQAPGGSLIFINEPKPDRDGVYHSWAVDFGRHGIEPDGSSEKGPGVLARITLSPQSSGSTPLVLGGVVLIDDASQRYTVDSIQSAAIHIGEPCPTAARQATPTPPPSSSLEESESSDDTSRPQPEPPAASGEMSPSPSTADGPPTPVAAGAVTGPAGGAPGAVPAGGGPPPPASAPPWLPASGLVALLTGLALLALGRRAARL